MHRCVMLKGFVVTHALKAFFWLGYAKQGVSKEVRLFFSDMY